MLPVLETHSSSCTEARSRFLDTVKERRVVLEAVVEPVVPGLEANQHAGRFPVPGNDDLRLRKWMELDGQMDVTMAPC